MKIFLVFPNQLFEEFSILKDFDKVYIIEDPLFFGDKKYPLAFHKFKLIFHRASMKFYEKFLLENSIKAEYIEYSRFSNSSPIDFYVNLFLNNEITAYEPVDDILKKRIIKASNNCQKKVSFLLHKGFLNSTSDNLLYLANYKKTKLFQTDFYIYQRKRLNILVENNKPVGGSWTYDTENRKRLPRNLVPFSPAFPVKNNFVLEAEKYVQQYFPHNPPFYHLEMADVFYSHFYPTTFGEAKQQLQDFLENRLTGFGPYEDALSDNSNFIYHSTLSPLLNSGLLTPGFLLKEVIKFYDSLDEVQRASILTSVEGFIRQIIGWREFMRLVYEKDGINMRNSNFFKFSKKLPSYWYSGDINNEIIAKIVYKTSKLAYLHHIERLMIVGNFMLLDEIAPDQVYKWFMEMFIDSYDWVMVPNVYGMSQYADGGSIVTKPYISGSNYLLKMGAEKGLWTSQWDKMFWNFIGKHKELFIKNPRMSMMIKLWEKRK